MRLILFLVVRGWRGNLLRTTLSILGIALGIAVVTAIHVMDHNTIQSRLRAQDPTSGRVDFEVIPKEAGRTADAVRDELAARADVAAIAVLHRTEVELRRGDAVDAAPAELGRALLFGLAPLPNRTFSHYVVAAGEDLSELDGDTAVLIGEGIATEAGIGVGDRLTIAPPARAPRSRCRDGERVADPTPVADIEPVRAIVRGILAPRFLGDREQGHVVIGTYALARRLAPRETTLFQVQRTAGADLDRIRQELGVGYLVRDEQSALLGESSDERAFRNGVKLLGGLALMLGMFVVFQTLSQSLVERMRQIGILRCLGTGAPTVLSVFLIDAVAMAVCGVLVGLALGLGLAWVLQQFQISTLGMLKAWEFHEIPLRPLAWTAALGVSFTLAGAGFPLWRIHTLSVVRVLHARGLGGRSDVLRGVNVFLFLLLVLVLPVGYLAMTTLLSDSERETQIVLLQLGALLLGFGALLLLTPALVRVAGRVLLLPVRWIAPLPAHLVRKAVDNQTGRFAASVCGLGIVLVAGIALESLTTALHGDARRFGATAMGHALYVRGDAIPPARAAELAAIPGIAAVDPLVGPVFAGLQLSGMDPALVARDGAPLHGRPEDQRRYAELRTVIVSSRLARLSNLTVGSAIALPTDGGPVAYTVLAVSDAVGFFPDEPAWAIAHPRWLKQDFCADEANVERLVLHLDPGASARDVLRAVRQELPGTRFAKSADELVDYLVRDVTRDFRLFQILLALVLLLGAVGVVNAMAIAALGRVREIGVLRALGTSRRQLRAAYLVEGGLTGGLAAVVALALGVPLGRLVVDGMNRVAGLDTTFVVPWHAIVAVPILGIAVGVGAAILPGLRAARVEPAEAVRFE